MSVAIKWLDWPTMKTYITTMSMSVRYFQDISKYEIHAVDSFFHLACNIFITTPANANQTDFETSIKPTANQILTQSANVQTQPPYGSKTIVVNGVTHYLYARYTGLQFQLQQGENTLTYTATYPWAKVVGAEVVNSEALDTVDFSVVDTPAGTYSKVPNGPLQKFAYTLNMPVGFYQRMSQFDMDIYQGMVVTIVYNSVSAKTIGINLLMDQVI